MLVDLETIIGAGFPPCLGYKDPWERATVADDLLSGSHSVLRTGLLPALRRVERVDIANAVIIYDGSGLGVVQRHLQTRSRRIWKHINTDAMSQEVIQRTAERTLNTVLLQDQAVNPIAYSEEVVKGFQTAYSFLLTHRDELLTPDGPLAAFCCGNGGRIELLVAASQRLQQPHLLEVARQWSSVLIRRSEQRGGFRLLAKLPRQAYHPGLFQGTAGIGYQLLRVAFPDQVPSVLLWE